MSLDIVIGVDPGKKTGVAVYGTHAKNFSSFVLPAMDACEHVHSILNTRTPTGPTIGLSVERFTQVRKRVLTPQNDALEVIGTMRWFHHWFELEYFEVNGASEATGIASDDVLKKLGWYVKNRESDQNRAAAQVVLALSRASLSEFDDLLKRARIV